MALLYYDAQTGKVYSLDGGYNSYQRETDPRSIPVSDLGALNGARKPTQGGAKGRETLVPGFMAGIEAMHQRFGKLPFKTLFEPAIWYAKNGVTISPVLGGFFSFRQSFLSRTPEGQRFLHQAGNDLPKAGDKFVQPELAQTLGAVATQGARYMYTGDWGKAFVAAVQKDGGQATADDMKAYKVTWNEPYTSELFGHTLYVNGAPNFTVYQVLTGLNIAESLGLQRRGPVWSDATTFPDLARISEMVVGAPVFSPPVMDALRGKGIDVSLESQRTKAFGKAVAPLLNQLFAAAPGNDPHHSNSLVVVDKSGSIAVMTHTINAVLWGDTGIVVGGIPIPDSAGFQQERLATLKPGDRLPNEIACTLRFSGKKPVLATAPIGSALVPETMKTILGVIGQKQDLADAHQSGLRHSAPAAVGAPGERAGGCLRCEIRRAGEVVRRSADDGSDRDCARLARHARHRSHRSRKRPGVES
jgi:gamma-glutamyltranspeptidase / glutathione hydrolase